MKRDSRPKQLSYESDGKMGHGKKEKNHKKEQRDFFNTTQNAE